MEPARSITGYSFVEAARGQSLQMRVVDPLPESAWDHVVELHRDAGCVHTTAWTKVLHQTYNNHSFYLRFSRGRRLAALIPLIKVRSPSWGTQGETIGYFRGDPSGRQCLALARRHSGFQTKIFEILPLMINQLAGSMIYTHLKLLAQNYG
jgi:hypothetical protein